MLAETLENPGVLNSEIKLDHSLGEASRSRIAGP